MYAIAAADAVRRLSKDKSVVFALARTAIDLACTPPMHPYIIRAHNIV